MKKILSLFLIAATVMLLVFLPGCNNDENSEDGGYYNYGLHYKIPEDYRHITVDFSEYTYYNGEAYFYFTYMSAENFVENDLPADISVEAYANELRFINSITSPVKYDKENNTALIEYVYYYTEADEVQLPPEFFYHYFLRGSELLYIVTMNCPEDKAEEYKPIFNEWMKDIRAD